VTKVFLVALLALLVVAPSLAERTTSAGTGVTIVSRELSVGGERMLASSRAPGRFDLVGLRWRGPGKVTFRTRSLAGRWSAWQTPDDKNPSWVGASDSLDYHVRGRVSRLRAYYIWSPVIHETFRRVEAAGSPPIVMRAQWGGNELLRRHSPQYASSVRLAIVHHTATPNNYTPDQAAAIVRGIDVYHVKANGWNDIGYNFLVDRFGRVYEGRYGGITRNVIGAHALGFNTGSVGIAVIGNFMTAKPTVASIQSLEQLIAWRLDVAHVDPVSTLTYVSNGSERWRAGTPAKLRAVSGHRDTGSTSCPGTYLYSQLDAIAAAAEGIGLPKLYAPLVRGKIGGPVVFSGRLSSALAWTIAVTGPSGRVVAHGSGGGPAISWTWNSAGLAAGRYTWTMSAGSNVRSASGVIGGGSLPPPPPPTAVIQGLTVSPVVSPNGDGYADTASVSYSLTARSTVTATVSDASGTVVETLFSAQQQSARSITFAFSPGSVPDGRYTLTIAAQVDAGGSGSASAAFVVDRTLGFVAASPSAVVPGSSVTASFALTAPGQATVTVLGSDGSTVATLFTGGLDSGSYGYPWSVRLADGTPAPPGQYQVQVSVVDPLGTVTQTAPFQVTGGSP
jgi:hypothetical protein